AAGTSGHEYELYYVNYLHITFTFARLVYDLPGEICCFLRPIPTANNSLKKISKRRRLAGRRMISIRSMCGKGGTHLIPHRKGVRRWKHPTANLANGASLTVTASWFFTMKPLTICGRCSVAGVWKYLWTSFPPHSGTSSRSRAINSVEAMSC